MKKNSNKDIRENSNFDNYLISQLVQNGVMNNYLMSFWDTLTEDGFEVIASSYNISFLRVFSFFLELREQIGQKNERNCLNSFNFSSVVLPQPNKSLAEITFGIRLDIFLHKKHQGIILPGVFIEKPIKDSVKKIKDIPRHPHFILIVRKGEEEKIEKTRIRAYREISKMKDVQSLLKNKIILDSLNPQKFPILKVDISKISDPSFVNCCKELPV